MSYITAFCVSVILIAITVVIAVAAGCAIVFLLGLVFNDH